MKKWSKSLRIRLKSFLRKLHDLDYIVFLFSIIILSFFVDPLLDMFRAKVFDGD
jgi:hypothetical protein